MEHIMCSQRMYNCSDRCYDNSSPCDSLIELIRLHGRPKRSRPKPGPKPGYDCECPPEDLLWRELISTASIFNSLKINLDAILDLDLAIIQPLIISFIDIAGALQHILDNPSNIIPMAARQETQALVSLYQEMGIPGGITIDLITAIQENNTMRMLYETARNTIQRSDLYALAETRSRRTMEYMGIMKNL